MPEFGIDQFDNTEDEWEAGEMNESAVELSEGEREAVESELDHIEDVVNNINSEEGNETISDLETSLSEVDGIFDGHPDYSPLLEDRQRAESKIMQGDSEAERQEGFEELIDWVEKTRELL